MKSDSVHQEWPTSRSQSTGRSPRSLGRSHLILHWISKIPKTNTFQSLLQEVH